MQGFNVDLEGYRQDAGVFGAFTEGLQLFASFAMLMNFPRFNKMKGHGPSCRGRCATRPCIATRSSACSAPSCEENPEIWTEGCSARSIACSTIVDHEDAFIDLAFGLGAIEGMTAVDVKRYIRFIADRRLNQVGLQPIYRSDAKNPLPWMDQMLNAIEHTNFFENRATEYSKASTRGTWDEAFL